MFILRWQESPISYKRCLFYIVPTSTFYFFDKLCFLNHCMIKYEVAGRKRKSKYCTGIFGMKQHEPYSIKHPYGAAVHIPPVPYCSIRKVRQRGVRTYFNYNSLKIGSLKYHITSLREIPLPIFKNI